MLNDVLSARKSLFDSGTHTELRGQLNRSRRVVLLSGNVVQNSRSDISGVSARVYRNGTYGFSSMAEYTPEAAEKVLLAATENAAFMDSHAGLGKPALPALKRDSYRISEDIHDPAQKIYIDFTKALDAYISEHYPQLTIRTIVATEDSMEKLLVTSDSMDSHTILPRSYCYVIMTAQTPDGNPVELYQVFGGEGTFDLNFTDPSACYPKIDELYGSRAAVPGDRCTV